jgi:hypothetical protein
VGVEEVQQAAVPDGEADDDTVVVVEQQGEVQPAAVPTEEEDEDTEVVEAQKRGSHSANQNEGVVVAVQAGRCASFGHDVEFDGEWDCPKSGGHVHFAVQQSGHSGGC